jgi:hypothetical protein
MRERELYYFEKEAFYNYLRKNYCDWNADLCPSNLERAEKIFHELCDSLSYSECIDELKAKYPVPSKSAEAYEYESESESEEYLKQKYGDITEAFKDLGESIENDELLLALLEKKYGCKEIFVSDIFDAQLKGIGIGFFENPNVPSEFRKISPNYIYNASPDSLANNFIMFGYKYANSLRDLEDTNISVIIWSDKDKLLICTKDNKKMILGHSDKNDMLVIALNKKVVGIVP